MVKTLPSRDIGRWAFPLLFPLLVGCASTYPLVGSYADYNAVFRGTVTHNLLGGGGTIELTGVNFTDRCQGEASPTTLHAGIAEVLCDGGTSVHASWRATSFSTGVGQGQDQEGRRMQFGWGMSEEEAAARVHELLRQSSDLQPLPAVTTRAPVAAPGLELPFPGLEIIREAGRPAPPKPQPAAPLVPQTP